MQELNPNPVSDCLKGTFFILVVFILKNASTQSKSKMYSCMYVCACAVTQTYTSRLLQLVKEVKQESDEAQELLEMGEYSPEEVEAIILKGKERIATFKATA